MTSRILALAWLTTGACCRSEPLIAPEITTAPGVPETDEDWAVALRYAPFLFQETDPVGGRQDLPSRVDFDGDLTGNNNWENFPRYRLLPTLYYAVVETETHLFLSYHVFHPRDWSPVRLGLQDVHENDGENLQVVVAKASGLPEFLYTQAHYRGRIHSAFLRVDENGVPTSRGTHAAVFVQAMGHGIYAIPTPCARVEVQGDGTFRFRSGSGIRLNPTGSEPHEKTSGTVTYQLESTVRKFWSRLPELVGNGRLFDGSVVCRRLGRDFLLPRYYDADLYSGPLGNDRGISPFALDVSFCPPNVGSLLIDPAHRYPELLGPRGEWSNRYVRNPFLE